MGGGGGGGWEGGSGLGLCQARVTVQLKVRLDTAEYKLQSYEQNLIAFLCTLNKDQESPSLYKWTLPC